jgi:hypothetical protein
MIYKNCTFAFGTQHLKETILQPAAKKILQAKLLSIEGVFNTDQLGTFSGEIERPGTPIEIAKLKALKAIELLRTPYGIGSEGSFGAHPFVPFVSGSVETLVFVDQIHHFTMTETQISSRTNFSHKIVKNSDHLDSFLTKALFPSHALIVRPNIWDQKNLVFKGIQSFEKLRESIDVCCSKSSDHSALVQTDMRAHFNPTRQFELIKAGIRLFRRLSRNCPHCGSPGWGIIGQKRGKRCSLCDCPTQYPTHWIWGCPTCTSTREKERYDFKEPLDPTYCNVCNP